MAAKNKNEMKGNSDFTKIKILGFNLNLMVVAV